MKRGKKIFYMILWGFQYINSRNMENKCMMKEQMWLCQNLSQDSVQLWLSDGKKVRQSLYISPISLAAQNIKSLHCCQIIHWGGEENQLAPWNARRGMVLLPSLTFLNHDSADISSRVLIHLLFCCCLGPMKRQKKSLLWWAKIKLSFKETTIFAPGTEDPLKDSTNWHTNDMFMLQGTVTILTIVGERCGSVHWSGSCSCRKAQKGGVCRLWLPSKFPGDMWHC